MKFVCERCHTKYSIADEKVRGKVLKVRCKTCENIITVRESGATIDEPLAAAGPKEAPIARSGTLEGGGPSPSPGGGGGSLAPARARRLSGAAAPVGTAAASVRPVMPAAAFTDPLAPAVAPPPRRRPTPGPAAALAVVLDDGLDWYLAVDGAQTGPFNRPTLIEKILAVPPRGDIHIWNAGLGAWKPPKEVADVLADVVRVRRAAQAPGPPPAPRRPSGALPTTAAHGGGGDPSSHRTAGANGVSALAEGGGDGHLAKGAEHKHNGVGAAAPAVGAAHKAGGGLQVEDLFNEDSVATTMMPAPVAAAAFGALPSATMSSSAGVAPVTAAAAAGAMGRPGRQAKLIMGAVALVVIVCGIVAVAVLRKPATTPSTASTLGKAEAEKAAKAPATEAPAVAAPPPVPTPPPPPAVDPTVARVQAPPDPRAKGGRVKGRRRGEGSGSPTTPPPIGGMTAEQLQAANRFGDSTLRDVRAVSGSAPAARSTPAQADISRVITNNRQGIQTCYQRALLRDSTLTQGRVTVRVWIGLSGKVKSVSLDAPAPFRTMESCVRDVMSRWAFPPSSEEYGTEFPFLLQGNQ